MSEETVRSGPIDLSRESDFALGDLQVSPSSREIIRDGARESLEPKAMQVLVALHQEEGRVVSRDDLIARCWDGRIVGEDAINRVVWRLRKLAEGDDGASFTIETIAKVGYRLRLAAGKMPSTASEPEAPLPRTASTAPASHAPSRQRLLAGAVLLVMAGAATWFLWPAPRWTVTSSRPFISTLAQEGEPAFSSDGKMLAYTSAAGPEGRRIYIRNLAGGDGIKLIDDGYDDASPTWSSDGARIAYIARKPGEPCRIMVAAVPAGTAREAGRCAFAQSTSLSWQPGTPFVYYFDQTGQAARLGLITDDIVRLDLDSGARLTVSRKPVTPIFGMEHLQCSPDGKSLLLVGRETALMLGVVVRDLTNGTERELGKILIRGSAAWAEDSRSVLTTAASGIGSAITAYPVNGRAPYDVYAAATNVSALAAGKGGLLALEIDPSRQNLARAKSSPGSEADIIDPAAGRSWAPTFAPDGTLAFLSNRSGTNAIWIMKPGAAARLLYDGGLLPLYRLEFSPDGKYLALPIATNDGVTIAIVTADGANVTSFHSPALGGGAPVWTPDSKEIIALDRDKGGYMRIAIADPTRRRPAVREPYGNIVFHKGAIFAERFDKAGFWQIDKEPRLVTAKYPFRWGESAALLGDELLVPDFDAADGPRILAQPLAGGANRVLAYAPGAQALPGVLESKMVVNPKTGEIIYVAAVESDTNIDLLTLAKR